MDTEDRGDGGERRAGRIFLADAPSIGSAVGSLPQELSERANVRLQWAAAAYGAAASLSVAAELAMTRDQRPATWVWTPAQVEDSVRFGTASVVLSLIFLAVLRARRLSPSVERRLGHVYWVLVAFGIALATSYEVHGHLGWVGVWILAGPLVLPSRPRRTLLVSLLCASAVPIAHGIHFARGLVDAASVSALASFALPNMVCAGLAYGIASSMYRLGRAVEQERRLGAYRLVARIGAGGMGEVWRAEHRTLVRPAAVKLVRRDQLAEGESAGSADKALLRFEREAQATALLSSPHTVEVFDFGVTPDGTFYIVMELLDGTDLHRLLRRAGGAVSPPRAAFLLAQVAHSLRDAHHVGLLHRDIKPANVFVCRKGLELDYVKVLDFGLVKQVESERDAGAERLTMEGAIAGTPGYMSPEAATAGAVDARSDIYSFGCLAYRMLAGRDVFEGVGAVQQLVLHATAEAEPVAAAATQPIPEDLARLVDECLAKDPARRPASMEEVARRLAATGLAALWTSDDAAAAWAAEAAAPDAEEAVASTEMAFGSTVEAAPELGPGGWHSGGG